MVRGRRTGAVFKRLETDAELRERLVRHGAPYYMAQDKHGEVLDEYAWNCYRVQRRVIEDSTEPPR